MTSAISGLSMSAEKLRRERDEARAVVKELITGYVSHRDGCTSQNSPSSHCTCGLDAITGRLNLYVP